MLCLEERQLHSLMVQDIAKLMQKSGFDSRCGFTFYVPICSVSLPPPPPSAALWCVCVPRLCCPKVITCASSAAPTSPSVGVVRSFTSYLRKTIQCKSFCIERTLGESERMPRAGQGNTVEKPTSRSLVTDSLPP